MMRITKEPQQSKNTMTSQSTKVLAHDVATACEAMPAPEISAEAVVRGALKGMGLAGLAKSVFPNSRPMEDW